MKKTKDKVKGRNKKDEKNVSFSILAYSVYDLFYAYMHRPHAIQNDSIKTLYPRTEIYHFTCYLLRSASFVAFFTTSVRLIGALPRVILNGSLTRSGGSRPV